MFRGNFKRLFLVMGICIVLLFAVGFLIDGLSSISSFAASKSIYGESWGTCSAESCENTRNTGSTGNLLSEREKSNLGQRCSYSDELKNAHDTSLVQRNCRTKNGDYSQGTCAIRYDSASLDDTCGGVGAYCTDKIPCRAGLKCSGWKRCYDPSAVNNDKVGQRCEKQYDCLNTATRTYVSLCAKHYEPRTSDPTCGGIGAYCSKDFRCHSGLRCSAYNRCE